ncbi:sugar ABC transporter permease [Mastigocoleus sp. MO_188.B34]|uniref:sugar ABC transporter permease n=1 Tax=Mastigocoleus sp. MO_188.B34 TaxID=3036635 RepID=UPI00262BEF58|nr:sugar ABC transporter permease [Mastigocoleus sp. MO_188.B34]MDJ0697178.1 sugar ABC transporter permease [Mastigocoleus sp. MO_188.B34]
MTNTSQIKIMISWSEDGLEDKELQAQTQKLIPEIKEVDGVETVNLVTVAEAPLGSKVFGPFSLGRLKTMVDPTKIKVLFEFIGDRMNGKAIELDVEANYKKLKLKVDNEEELVTAIETAQKFISE